MEDKKRTGRGNPEKGNISVPVGTGEIAGVLIFSGISRDWERAFVAGKTRPDPLGTAETPEINISVPGYRRNPAGNYFGSFYGRGRKSSANRTTVLKTRLWEASIAKKSTKCVTVEVVARCWRWKWWWEEKVIGNMKTGPAGQGW